VDILYTPMSAEGIKDAITSQDEIYSCKQRLTSTAAQPHAEVVMSDSDFTQCAKEVQ